VRVERGTGAALDQSVLAFRGGIGWGALDADAGDAVEVHGFDGDAVAGVLDGISGAGDAAEAEE
jgi:hypothetical protein